MVCRKVLAAIMVVIGLVSGSNIRAESSDIPKDFFYQNSPVDPFCVSKLSNIDAAKPEPVNIDTCSKHSNIQFESTNERLTKNKFFGYDYSEKLPSGYTAHGYNYYRYLGKLDNLHVIYSIQNGGGSGEFTTLMLVRRVGNTLHLAKLIASGDRCNWGLSDVSFKDQKIQYKQAITPYDMVALSQNKPETIKAYDDLASCAVCCIGQAQYEYANDESTLNSIILEKDAGSNNASVQGKLQPCFDTLIKEYKAQEKDKFTVAELDEFTAKFKETCLKP